MMSLPRALAVSVGQLRDPAILRVLGKTALITLVIFLALGWAMSIGFDALLERAGFGDFAGAGTLLAIVATIVGAWLLFRIVALAVLQFFAEDIVRAVEARHYPAEAAMARSLSFREELSNSLRSTSRAVLVNLAVLPFALFLLVTGVGTALLFWFANALLLGRELQDMVWLRHRADSEELAPIPGLTRFLLGGAVAALLVIPFVNLLAPIIGAASATHMVHRNRKALKDA